MSWSKIIIQITVSNSCHCSERRTLVSDIHAVILLDWSQLTNSKTISLTGTIKGFLLLYFPTQWFSPARPAVVFDGIWRFIWRPVVSLLPQLALPFWWPCGSATGNHCLALLWATCQPPSPALLWSWCLPTKDKLCHPVVEIKCNSQLSSGVLWQSNTLASRPFWLSGTGIRRI